MIFRRALFGLAMAAVAKPAAAQVILPNRRVDDLVRRVARLEDRMAQQGERIASLEERTRAKPGA